MERILTWSIEEDFIERLSLFILKNFNRRSFDFSRVACVFGGRRPALFLRRRLAEKIRKAFYPPRFFSIDEFVEYVASEGGYLSKVSELDACFIIYTLVKKHAPDILKGRGSWSEFLPWGREIISFIEQLDLEDIPSASLLTIEKSAAIGYDVPRSINVLLEHITIIREAYHAALKERQASSRGTMYLQASKAAGMKEFSEFDAIIFCNFFYLHRTEAGIIKEICNHKKGICIFQGSPREWPVLQDNCRILGVSARGQAREPLLLPNFNLYAAFDLHSQICLLREILKKIKNLDKTVIVLPRPEAVIPLLAEISSQIKDFNVSLGYPLRRSSLFTLFKTIFNAHESKKGSTYYARDYLNVLRHPFVKNIRFSPEAAVTRVLVHKIEEVLTGRVENYLGGVLFASLDDIENSPDIYSLARDTLKNMDISADRDELKKIVRELNRIFFRSWEKIGSFRAFAGLLDKLINLLLNNSMAASFPLNLKAIPSLFTVKDELATVMFNEEPFSLSEIEAVFLQKLEEGIISFSGSPLRGLQILGLLETRSLSFDNVILMDLNEGAFPQLKVCEPLIPREIMLSLGINRLEKEEEIQHYQFMRLLSAAKNTYLIYEENQAKEKSRFIEELLWRRQRQAKSLEAIAITKAAFRLRKVSRPPSMRKTQTMIDFLKNDIFSPTKLDTYLTCPLRFYYKYVLGLSEEEDLLDEPQAVEIGIFIHQLLEDTFKKFVNRRPLINSEFRREFFRIFKKRFAGHIAKRMKSDSYLLEGVMKSRLQRFLDAEAERDIKKIVCLERKFEDYINLCGTSIRFICKVDRIDECSPSRLAIIDYKTGRGGAFPKKLEQLESMELERLSIKDNIKSFQLPLYYYFVKKHFPALEVNAELYNLCTLERKPFVSEQDYPQAERAVEICLRSVEFIFSQLFNPEIPFEPDRDEKRCRQCEFVYLCG